MLRAAPKIPTMHRESKEEKKQKQIRNQATSRCKDDHKSQLEFQFGFYRGTESIASSTSC